MSTTTDDLRLAADFAPANYENWRKLVDGVLKGAPFEKLISKSYDGIAIQPIYARTPDAAPIDGRAAAAPWQVMQRVDHPDAAKSNRQALHDLENGATGLSLVFEGTNGGRGFGLVASEEAIATLLDGIYLDAGIGIELQAGPQSRMAVTWLTDIIKVKGIDAAKCDIRFGLDPIGACAVWGTSAHGWDEIAPVVTDTVKKLDDAGFKGPFMVADGRIVHDAGGSEVQELAYTLSVLLAYLRALDDAGFSLENARGMVYARLTSDADQFLTMAKFRALRLLWARVEESCGLRPKPLFIAAETAWRMMTQRDSAVNMLRATMATFSAGLAGANSICVLPHTLALGMPDSGARRIARNTQLILLEESNLAKVTDPAAGAGGIETLTRELCDAAWTMFQDIEKAGGTFAALIANTIQSKVAATRAAHQSAVAKRRDVLTGASEFPNLQETRASVLKVKPVPAKPYGKDKIRFRALEPIRFAEPFEALRDKSDHLLARKGARPKVFLANLGTPADFTARATFAKSFFETGGIEAIDTDGFTDPAALAEAFKASGASLACLCSSDKQYPVHAAAAAKTLQSADAKHIYLAGRPGDLEADLRAAGVQDFVFAGGDALAMLVQAYALME